MRKFVHLKCEGGRLHPWKDQRRKVDPVMAECDDLLHPIPEHVVGNMLRQMCGLIPIPAKMKYESHRSKMQKVVELWKENPLNAEIDNIANQAFVKYLTPKGDLAKYETARGSKENKCNSHQKGVTFFDILNEDGTTKSIKVNGVISWPLFKKCFGKFGALDTFKEFFSKYIPNFSYDGSLKDAIFELSKHWHDESYKEDVKDLLTTLREKHGLPIKNGEVIIYNFQKLLMYPEETKPINLSTMTKFTTNASLLNMSSPFAILVLNAEVVVPFDMDNEVQAKLYEMLENGSGLSKFLGNGYAHLLNLDKKSHENALYNEGFAKISEEYDMQRGKDEEDT